MFNKSYALALSPDTLNDQTDLQVQLPTPCAHYPPRRQTIHPARDVIVAHQSNWQTPADLQIITY